MNRSFKVVFNKAAGVFQAVAETAKSHVSSSSSSSKSSARKIKASAIVTAVALAMGSSAVHADFTLNGDAGDANINTNGGTLNVGSGNSNITTQVVGGVQDELNITLSDNINVETVTTQNASRRTTLRPNGVSSNNLVNGTRADFNPDGVLIYNGAAPASGINASYTSDGVTVNDGTDSSTLSATDLNTTNAALTGNLDVDGDTTLDNTTVDGTLDVTGDSTLGGTLDVYII